MKTVKSMLEKLRNIPLRFRTLPIRTKQLLSLGIVLALVVALPLFIWGITTQRFTLRRFATGEPTPTPLPSPSPTRTPTGSPKPTPSPTPTPINNPPVITTTGLPWARVGRAYYATVTGYDVNTADILSMNVSGLPKGLSRGTCTQSVSGGKLQITCPILGKVTAKPGNYQVFVTLSDNRGGVARKTFTLRVIKPYLLF